MTLLEIAESFGTDAFGTDDLEGAFAEAGGTINYEALTGEGFSELIGTLLDGQIANSGKATELAGIFNSFINDQSRERIEGYDPNFFRTIGQLGQNALSFSRGVLPAGMSEDVARQRGRTSTALGIPGTDRGQVARDLGLSRLDVMNQGANTLGSIASTLNIVDPVARYLTGAEFLPDTGQAAAQVEQSRQFENTVARSERDALFGVLASPNPYDAALANAAFEDYGLQFGSGGTTGTTAASSGGSSGVGQGVGALIGGILGSVVPVAGTYIGAAAGAAIGGGAGAAAESSGIF